MFKKRRFMMENYLRILQTSTRNFFNLQDTMSLHNSLLYDLLISLKSRRKTLSQLSLGSKQNNSVSNSEANQSDHSSTHSTIHFYVSQVIQTPDGIGTVISINEQKKSLSVYFPDKSHSTADDSCPSTKEYSCLSLYNFFKETPQCNIDAYHLSNLEKKWSYQSVLSNPLELETQNNLKQIHKLSADDLYSLIQPSQPTQSSTCSSKKAKRNSKSTSQEENSTNVPPAPLVTLSSVFRATDQPTATKKSLRQSQLSSLLFLKPGTLPYVVEKLQPDDSNLHQAISSSSRLSFELSAQAYSPSTYTHHALPSIYDDSFFESIGFELDESSKYQTVDPSAETELIKIQELSSPNAYPHLSYRILKPLLDKIRQCREEAKLAALQVERSKTGSIRQYLEISSLRLGLFTHQLLMKSVLNLN